LPVFTSLFGCDRGEKKLSEISEINEVFTHTEIEDLELLYNFFCESICLDNNESIINCYKTFLKSCGDSAEQNGSLFLPFSFDKQLDLYQQFSDSTFHQIWSFGKSWNRKENSDTLKYVYYKWDGKFHEFLRITSKETKFSKQYLEAWEAAGDISPTLIAGITHNHDQFDLRDLRVRFILAIHFLTLNDSYKRKEKYSG
jgi:hypothetical protein